MDIKLFELRDSATFIPVFAFRAESTADQEHWLLRRAGFGPSSGGLVIMGRLECSGIERNCTYDPYAWGGRTFPVAHEYIAAHWDELASGSVIDVQFLLGETQEAKTSERHYE